MRKYWDSEGNEIGFAAATKFQARAPREFAEAQKARRSARVEVARAARLPDGVIASFQGMQLRDDGQLTSRKGGGPLIGASARVDVSGSRDIASRRTMMRTVTPLAFLGQKKMESDTRQCFLVVEGRGWAVTESVLMPREGDARAFAAKVNAAALAVSPSDTPDPGYSVRPGGEASRPRPTPPTNDDLASQLSKLSEMKHSGVLTDEEFVAAKARLLGTA